MLFYSNPRVLNNYLLPFNTSSNSFIFCLIGSTSLDNCFTFSLNTFT